MTIESKLVNEDKDLIIKISGGFNFEVFQEFRDAYTNQQAENYVIDLVDTERLDSDALGMLLNMRKVLGDSASISIINPRPKIKKLLKISRLDRKFQI